MFALFQIIQLILGLWMWTLIGRALLWMLIPGDARGNFFYRVMSLACWPVLAPLRAILPRAVPDGHVGFYALILVVLLRIGSYMFFYSQGWLPEIEVPPGSVVPESPPG